MGLETPIGISKRKQADLTILLTPGARKRPEKRPENRY